MVERQARRPRRAAGLRNAVVVAAFVVPWAGAAEAPLGWPAAGAAALGVLALALVWGDRLRWAWLAAIAALVGLVVPRGPWGVIGPPLFVTTVLCLVLWIGSLGSATRG